MHILVVQNRRTSAKVTLLAAAPSSSYEKVKLHQFEHIELLDCNKLKENFLFV